MNYWKTSNEASLPEKEDFFSNLNMEDITDTDYTHAKRICKDFEIENLGDIKSNAVLLADVFENFQNMCLEIYELAPTKCLPDSGLVWQATFKKPKVKLDLLTDKHKLLIVEKGIRGGMCHCIYRYFAKANSIYMKYYDKYKEP